MLTYPQIYEYKAYLKDDDKEIKFLTTTLLEAVTKLARPQYTEDCSFFTAYGWRIRFEMHPNSYYPDKFKYVLDVGQSYDFGTMAEFKQSCEDSNSAISVAYCDNEPSERTFIAQEHGVFRVYAMTAGNISEHARQRWVTEFASTFVKAINSLNGHFVVVDTKAIRLSVHL